MIKISFSYEEFDKRKWYPLNVKITTSLRYFSHIGAVKSRMSHCRKEILPVSTVNPPHAEC